MTLRENLLEELSKLRLSRESPPLKQASKRGIKIKKSTISTKAQEIDDELKKLLSEIEGEGGV